MIYTQFTTIQSKFDYVNRMSHCLPNNIHNLRLNCKCVNMKHDDKYFGFYCCCFCCCEAIFTKFEITMSMLIRAGCFDLNKNRFACRTLFIDINHLKVMWFASFVLIFEWRSYGKLYKIIAISAAFMMSSSKVHRSRFLLLLLLLNGGMSKHNLSLTRLKKSRFERHHCQVGGK